MKKALITGIDGFVGNYLTANLLNDGYEVYGTSIIPNYKKDNVTRTKRFGNSKSAKIVLIKKVIQSKKVLGGYHSTVDNFKFIIDKKLIYNKPKYKKIRGNYYEYKNIVNRSSVCCS